MPVDVFFVAQEGGSGFGVVGCSYGRFHNEVSLSG
jgi:hypothetical protein